MSFSKICLYLRLFPRGKIAFSFSSRKCYIEKAIMFEEIASSAVKMLILFFWTTIAFIIIWVALWLKAHKKG